MSNDPIYLPGCRTVAWLIGMLAFGGLIAGASAGEADLAEQVVDALNKADGAYPGFRANHAKGLVAEGVFVPASEAAELSKAVLFRGQAIPVTVRFSSGSGIPTVADGSSRANPHGLAVKYHLPDGSETDMVLNSRKFFPVATGEEFRDLELAVAASQPEAAKPSALDEFVARHPLVSIPLETPESLAEEQYNGIDAFILTNRAGTEHAVRYLAVPPDIRHLAPEDAAKRSPDFLFDDLRARLAASPVLFELRAQLAEPGDPITDATQAWPQNRQQVLLGQLIIGSVVPDSPMAEKALIFLPGLVTDGIRASDDPLIQLRDDAYAVSFGRRSQ